MLWTSTGFGLFRVDSHGVETQIFNRVELKMGYIRKDYNPNLLKMIEIESTTLTLNCLSKKRRYGFTLMLYYPNI